MKDYKYVREHPEEYAEEYAKVKNSIAKDFKDFQTKVPSESILDRIIELSFHMKLIESKKESKPKKCSECPMLSSSFLPNGQLCTQCDLNIDWFTGDSFFGWHATKRPEWCPLDKKK